MRDARAREPDQVVQHGEATAQAAARAAVVGYPETPSEEVEAALAALAAGVLAGWLTRRSVAEKKLGAAEHEARAIIDELTREGAFTRPIVTEVCPLTNYHPAEDYHQDFFARNPYQGYCLAVAAPKVAKFRQTFARLVR